MIAFDDTHPLRVVGDDEYDLIRRKSMIRARLDRIRAGRSAKELAKVAHVGERTMQGLFKHPEAATLETVGALCEALGIDMSEIRGYADPMTPGELAALYMDEALTDEDRRIVAATLRHIHSMRKPPRFRLVNVDPTATYDYDWRQDAIEQGKADAENL